MNELNEEHKQNHDDLDHNKLNEEPIHPIESASEPTIEPEKTAPKEPIRHPEQDHDSNTDHHLETGVNLSEQDLQHDAITHPSQEANLESTTDIEPQKPTQETPNNQEAPQAEQAPLKEPIPSQDMPLEQKTKVQDNNQDTQKKTLPKIKAGLKVELDNYQIEQALIDKIPIRLVRRYNFIPVFTLENVLTIATPDPDDLDTIDKINQATKFDIDTLYATHDDVQKNIDKYYGVISEVDSLLMSMDESKLVETRASQIETTSMFDIGEENIDDAPAVRIVNLVIRDAIVRGASDIHLEPADKNILLRLRIDGKLLEVNKLPKSMLPTIISRIKVIGEMDIAESRTPQDGRIRAKYQNGRYDLRISVLPTVYGENVVIRISGGDSLTAKLNSVGFENDDLDMMRACLSASQGMFLVTGPTGSGKTTTLYACLEHLNRITHNIITLEDPVEKEIPLIRQVNINDKVGLTFGTGLRSVLRQDPDIVMVGEIRDQETAQLAIRASLTGHYVLSTVHTNDCPSTITRIVDIGVKPFLVASALNGILAQRLVRRVCENCEETFKPDPKVLQLLELPYDHDYKRGAGCDLCRKSGYLGRIPIFELMILNREMRDAIAEDATADELRHLALRNSMKTMVKDGRAKILHGLTTPEEVLSVTTLSSENA